jgi:hypothetical protein
MRPFGRAEIEGGTLDEVAVWVKEPAEAAEVNVSFD